MFDPNKIYDYLRMMMQTRRRVRMQLKDMIKAGNPGTGTIKCFRESLALDKRDIRKAIKRHRENMLAI